MTRFSNATITIYHFVSFCTNFVSICIDLYRWCIQLQRPLRRSPRLMRKGQSHEGMDEDVDEDEDANGIASTMLMAPANLTVDDDCKLTAEMAMSELIAGKQSKKRKKKVGDRGFEKRRKLTYTMSNEQRRQHDAEEKAARKRKKKRKAEEKAARKKQKEAEKRKQEAQTLGAEKAAKKQEEWRKFKQECKDNKDEWDRIRNAEEDKNQADCPYPTMTHPEGGRCTGAWNKGAGRWYKPCEWQFNPIGSTRMVSNIAGWIFATCTVDWKLARFECPLSAFGKCDRASNPANPGMQKSNCISHWFRHRVKGLCNQPYVMTV